MNRARMLRVGLGVLFALSFGASVFMFLLGTDLFDPVSHRSDVFSRSFIGHRAFVTLLERTDRPILLNRAPARLAESTSQVAWIAEPVSLMLAAEPGEWFDRRLLRAGQTTFLVLPERSGAADPDRRGWILDYRRVSLPDVHSLLDRIGVDATVVRPSHSVKALSERWPEWEVELEEPQLLRGEGIESIVSCDDGIAVGRVEVDGHRFILISDAELVANDGLSRADHANVVMALIDGEVEAGQTLMIDASLQGWPMVASIWSEFASPPLIFATVQLGLLGLVALWAAAGRFGRPSRSTSLPRPGKGELIENTTRLMVSAGHEARLANRHARFVMESVGSRLHAPHPADARATAEWLAPLEERRTSLRAQDLLKRAYELRTKKTGTVREVLSFESDLATWRREMLRGPRQTPVPER